MNKRTSVRKNKRGKISAHVTEITVSDSYISALPASILIEIFLRFPIVDLMKFMLVCTSWYKLISESSFTDIYVKNSPFTTLLLRTTRTQHALSDQVLCLLEISENGDCIRTPIRPRLPHWLRTQSTEFVISSCNGLLSFSLQSDEFELVYVSNPITGEYIALPYHEKEHDDDTFALYKIGFSSVINNFKVLRIGYGSWLDSKVDECEIFTVGVDDKWRRVDNPFTNLCFWADGISVNGAIHWILEDKGSFQISTFNLVEERGGQIPHPHDLVLDVERMSLALFDNQLSIVDDNDPLQISIWSMKEYGILDSWTKVTIFRSWFPDGMHITIPVAKLQNGDIIFGDSNSLISINVEQKRCSKIGVFVVPRVACGIIPYTPSFKSLSEAIMRGHW